MSRITGILSLLLVVLFNWACQNRNEIYSYEPIPRIDTIVVNWNKNKQISFQDLVDGDKTEYVQLSTENDFLIGQIDKLLVTDDCLFVMDRKISRSVFAFNHYGNPIVKVSRSGNGKGEYVAMRDISFDEKCQELVIYDFIRKKMIHYSLTGKFIKETDVPFYSLRVQAIEDKYIIYNDYYNNKELLTDKKQANLILLDSKSKAICAKANEFPSIPNKTIIFSSEAELLMVDDSTLSIKPDHCNTVYHVTSQEIYPAYKLDFGKDNVDERYWNRTQERNISFKELDEYCNSLQLCESFKCLEANDYLYFTCRRNRETCEVIYSKCTKKTFHTGWVNVDRNYRSIFKPITIYKNRLYCIIEAELICNMRENLKDVIPDNILNSVNELDNPIIAILTLIPF